MFAGGSCGRTNQGTYLTAGKADPHLSEQWERRDSLEDKTELQAQT